MHLTWAALGRPRSFQQAGIGKMGGIRFLRLSPLVALLALAAPVSAAGAAEGSSSPSCAAGPWTVGDVTVGTPCDDRIVVAADVAKVDGGGGDDVIVAPRSAADGSCPEGCHLGVGSQTFEGGPGNDVVYGERGNDILHGGDGNDRLYGGIGDDLLQGGPGDDLLAGGFGADGIDGEAGSDFVRGDATQDEIADSGPAGDLDTLSYATGVTPGFPDNPNNPAYPDFSAHTGFPAAGGERGVYLNLNPSSPVADNGVAPDGGGVDRVEGADFERVLGTPFSDYIVGARAGLSIYGGGGADVLIGEGTGDRLDGGADGDDCVEAATAVSCESEAAAGPVVPRDTEKASVGLMAPPAETGEAEIYLVGASSAETLAATYSPGPPVKVTFNLTAGAFDSASASAGCTTSASQAECTLPGALDSVLIAGMGGDDGLQASGFPSSVSVIVLGGGGGDTLTGGEASEDVLVDGPGDDTLSSLGGDDAVLNNDGIDQVLAGGGNDLFLSNSICDGDLLNGGEGRDNASWAKFKASVEARVGAGDAGRPGPGGAPECSGGTFDSLHQVEDLEGTAVDDVLYGGPESNQLLGHTGPDTYFAEGGNDTILANSADFDPTIDCGDGNDLAVIDFAQYGDVAAPDCETVREGAPNNFQADTELPPEVAPTPLPERAVPPSNRFKLLGLKLDRRHGTARLRIRVPGAGRLAVHGKGVRPLVRESPRAATVVVTIRPNSRLARAMRHGERRARVTVTITFRPRGGSARSARKALTLIRAV
jgi:Ca2+-binding RTX toxin-like protein